MKIYKNDPRSEVQNIWFYKIKNDQIRKEKSVSMVKSTKRTNVEYIV